MRGSFVTAFVVLTASCSGGNTMTDGSTDAPVDASGDRASDGPTVCVGDNDCSDNLFCNGAERCMPGAMNADARGCVPPASSNPCVAGQMCDEAAGRCTMDCPDHDGDGHGAMPCGDDCDDNDGNRFPGNREVCNTMHDEDCDPCTVGDLPPAPADPDPDADDDTFVSTACGNAYSGSTAPTCDPNHIVVDASHSRVTGSDCDDTRADVHRGNTEVCDDRDNNCDGMADEGLPLHDYWPDCDADGNGDSSVAVVHRCGPPSASPTCATGSTRSQWVNSAGDCNDNDPQINPSAIEVCDGDDNNCDGITDGAMASANCRVANAMGACTGGACHIGACLSGFNDCDGVDSNGCEVNLQTDVANCGSCGHVCPAPTGGGSPLCSAGACVSSCPAGTHVCGSSCIASTSILGCGTSCTPCAQPANSVSSCDGTACHFTCNAPFQMTAGGCHLLPIRLVAPLSTSRVTSQRPDFRWQLPTGTGAPTGAHVQVCTDPSCVSVVLEWDAPGNTTIAPSALTAGALFWRAFPMVSGARDTTPTNVWEIVIPRRNAAQNSVTSQIVDFNLDGNIDVIVRGYYSASLYLGTPSGLSLTPAATAPTTTVLLGDVNGDGRSDIVDNTQYSIGYPIQPAVYFGTTTGLPPIPSQMPSLTGPLDAAGDFDGDGYADALQVSGTLVVYGGGPSGIGPMTAMAYDPTGRGFNTLMGAGDLNGDGRSDLVIASTFPTPQLYLVPGGVTSSPTPMPLPFAADQIAIADFDHDGYNDVGYVVPGGTAGAEFRWNSGGPSFLSTTTQSFLVGRADSMRAVGDVNGDGFDDLYVYSSSTGTCQHFGSITGFMACVPTTTIYSNYLGDLNRDGYDDAVMQTSTTGGDLTGAVLRGSVSGLGTTPSGTFTNVLGSVFYAL